MKIGLQTISWGTTFQDMNIITATAQELGYEGLVFGQVPDLLWPGARLQSLLDDYGLCGVGLTGGSLRRQIEYASELRLFYLCTDEWDADSVTVALDKGLRVGIHPHLYKTIESVGDAERYLGKSPSVGLVLDTGHLYLADDDILKAIENHHDRILAVHLKDWNSRYGRSPFRFARGFCALGTGELQDLLESTVKLLVSSNFGGWLIVDQDSPSGDANNCATISRQWLRSQGI